MYCDVDFGPYLEEMKVTVRNNALDAASRINLEEFSSLNPLQGGKIQELFSRKFKKEWPKEKHQCITDYDNIVLLAHTIDWSLFSHCIKVGCKIYCKSTHFQ